ncbi:MAG: DUF5106 domain-containing protein [Candidatus Cyclobacteriaceae bacterium M2_1C_046]
MKKLIAAVSLIFMSSFAIAQNGYDLDFKIVGLQDTTVYLGHFFGESTYVKDTARINSKGEFSFEGNQPLPGGIYFLVMNKTRVFDFVVNKDQQFSISTSAGKYIEDMKIEGDVDNKLFLANLLYNAERNKEATPHVSILQDQSTSVEAKAEARKQLQQLNQKVMAYQDSIIARHPDAIVSKLYKSTRQVEIPTPPAGADSTFAFKYYRAHYFDNFDLADETLLRLSEPIYRKKVEDYLDRLVMQHPDSLTNAINNLADKAKANEETYKYLIWTTVLKYQHPEIMGLDEVFVNIYDKYFATGEMDYWANASLKENLKEQADKYRKSLIGKTASNLTMLDSNLEPQSLYGIKSKYTVLYFFDPDCGFCKKETPVIKEFTDNTKLDVGVFAVSADTSMAKMKKYIKEAGMEEWVVVNGPRTYTKSYQSLYDADSTPMIYILDENKKIIAKKIPAARIEDVIKNHEQRKKSLQ